MAQPEVENFIDELYDLFESAEKRGGVVYWNLPELPVEKEKKRGKKDLKMYEKYREICRRENRNKKYKFEVIKENSKELKICVKNGNNTDYLVFRRDAANSKKLTAMEKIVNSTKGELLDESEGIQLLEWILDKRRKNSSL